MKRKSYKRLWESANDEAERLRGEVKMLRADKVAYLASDIVLHVHDTKHMSPEDLASLRNVYVGEGGTLSLDGTFHLRCVELVGGVWSMGTSIVNIEGNLKI